MLAEEECADSKDKLMQFWKTHVAAPLREMWDEAHCHFLVEEIKDYLFALREEYKVVSQKTLPSITKYFSYRVGAISVKFLVVATE